MQTSTKNPHPVKLAAYQNASANFTPSSVIESFRHAMQSAGIHCSGEIIGDGRIHRFHIDGHKHGSQNGAYILHLDGCPAGWFMDHTTKLSQTWHNKNGSKASFVSIEQIEATKQKWEAETRQRNEAAMLRAAEIWKKCKPIANQADHPYLVKKRIQPHEARLHQDSLVIPIYNDSDRLTNLQFIKADGKKRFLKDGCKKGCFHIIGDVSDKILICEGFATGASLHEDTGKRVVIALDAGNLEPVARNIKALSLGCEIIICGDNDVSGAGQREARKAALAIGGKVLIPEIPGKDWNDILAGENHA